MPKLLDLFCGAGGAAYGYHQDGFEVVGVDIQIGTVMTGYKPNETTHGATSYLHSAMSAGVQTFLTAGGTIQSNAALAPTSKFLLSQGSVLPYTTDWQLVTTSTSGSTTVDYYGCGSGGSGSTASFYTSDGSVFTANPYSFSGSPSSVSLSATGNSVYFLAWLPYGSSTMTIHAYPNTAPTQAQVQTALADGRFPTLASVTTRVLAGSGGTLGGTNGCPAVEQMMKCRKRGVEMYLPAGALEPGDEVRTWQGAWVELHKAFSHEGLIYEVQFPEETIRVDASHWFMDRKGNWVNVATLTSKHQLMTNLGRGRTIARSVREVGWGRFQALSIDAPFAYELGRTISHNIKSR